MHLFKSCATGNVKWNQWRTQKMFMGGFHSEAYGGRLYLLCSVCDITICRHIHVSKPTFLFIRAEIVIKPCLEIAAGEILGGVEAVAEV